MYIYILLIFNQVAAVRMRWDDRQNKRRNEKAGGMTGRTIGGENRQMG